MKSLKLVLLPGLKVKKASNHQMIITQKFIDGVFEYQKYWPGSIVVLIEEDEGLNKNLDNRLINVDELPFDIEIINFDSIPERQELHENSVFLSSTSFRHNQISKVCKSHNIPCIYITEYSLKTRMQIINATTQNPILRLRRYVWQILQEFKQRKAIAIANGVQCNGVPTYKAYQKITPNPCLYFDTRITEDMIVSPANLATRTDQCLEKKPLRLLFSGRLIKMKGADHLILVAENLKKLGVKFEMFICGDGELKETMQQQIELRGLSDSIKMLGVLEFKTELVPFVQKNVDLFICCHRQGDPSCTYLETMSCGVPIVGYDNEAFVGVVHHSQAGWFVKMNRPDLLAGKIAELNQNREAIVAESYQSLEFAKQHTFEKTFQRRIAHIQEIAAIREDFVS
ncbi:Glycosyl transferase group 1 [Planktothrix serta PCC 8927]|uniref:Glycosyl transferase group 1 n=1 Tax=Planktothrix serta PCC 8927 TaxID=671068 RepID=A0A7Z9E4Z9_9CYAN|nr:glycosyltransferase [Planktothrix serta]VXD23480.1 Glycosyl transferase group 1 [Planktothrix serta PCC 8927]